jgi:MoxR-like ATPase
MELLERSSFLDALADYAAEARHGSGRLVLVSGESGIGKTALVEAFQAQLHGARWPGWLAQVRAVRAELLWVSGQPDLARQEAREDYGQARRPVP